MVESTTAVSTRPTEVSLLNCASRIAKIRKIAVPNALSRNAGLGALLVLALEPEGHARAEIGLGELARDLLLDLGGLHAFGDVGRDRHHAAAVDAVDVADARAGSALTKLPIGTCPTGVCTRSSSI